MLLETKPQDVRPPPPTLMRKEGSAPPKEGSAPQVPQASLTGDRTGANGEALTEAEVTAVIGSDAEVEKQILKLMDAARQCVQDNNADGALGFALAAAKLRSGGDEASLMKVRTLHELVLIHDVVSLGSL